MAFDDIIRSGVALANSMTASLQPTVQHYVRTGQDGYGKPTYAAPVNVPAVVDKDERYVQNAQGQTVLTRHRVTFVRPIIIKSTDKLVLPDGSTGPILSIGGVVDPDTDRPFSSEVLLG